jgi:eukaryotic-like serine/threonine-protein kinase
MPTTVCDVFGAGRGGAWTSDGRIIFAALASWLVQVPASGGTVTRLTQLASGDAAHYWPQMLPGGHILYLVQSGQPDRGGVFAASLTDPNQRVRLVNTDANAVYASGYLLWMRGTTLVAQPFDPIRLKLSGEPRPLADPAGRSAITGRMNVSASTTGLLLYSATGSNQLTWLDRAGKPLGTLAEPNDYVIFRISPDGRRVAASVGNPTRADLWLIDVPRNVASRFTFTGNGHSDPVWSPDGRVLLFRAGNSLFRKDASGAGDEQQVLKPSGLQLPTSWSRDGRLVLFDQTTPGAGFDIWALPVTPDGAESGEPKRYSSTPSNKANGQFSPDGHWVAYESYESGQAEVYIQAFPEPRGKFQISAGGGRFPRWGPGGRELYYVSLDDKLMAVDLKPRADSIEASAPRGLFPLPTPTINFIPYDVTADGQRFLVQAPPEQASPLTVVVNWPALARAAGGE